MRIRVKSRILISIKSRAGSWSGSASKSQLKSSRLRFLLNKNAVSGGQAPRRKSQWRLVRYVQEKCTDEWNIRTERRAGTQTQYTMKMSMSRKNRIMKNRIMCRVSARKYALTIAFLLNYFFVAKVKTRLANTVCWLTTDLQTQNGENAV